MARDSGRKKPAVDCVLGRRRRARGERRVTRYPDFSRATHHRVSFAGRIDDYEMSFLAQLVEHTVAEFLPQFSATEGLHINFVDL